MLKLVNKKKSMVSTLVVIPHFNDSSGLEISLRSIGKIEPVHVLVVDDGSNSKHKPVAKNLRKKFPWINSLVVQFYSKNRGIAFVLNDGLRYARNHGYAYVARLDCRDTCTPHRFRRQIEFLEKHPDHYLVGSWAAAISEEGNPRFTLKLKADHEDIVKKMPIANQFCHPAVLFRTKAIDKVGYYPTDRLHAEDYAYFFRFVKTFKVANIPEVLVHYELNPTGLSLSNRRHQIHSRIRIILDNFSFDLSHFYSLARNGLIYLLPESLTQSFKHMKNQ
ncbi:MAG: glycosyltransferase [Thiotrichales bacterium]